MNPSTTPTPPPAPGKGSHTAIGLATLYRRLERFGLDLLGYHDLFFVRLDGDGCHVRRRGAVVLHDPASDQDCAHAATTAGEEYHDDSYDDDRHAVAGHEVAEVEGLARLR